VLNNQVNSQTKSSRKPLKRVANVMVMAAGTGGHIFPALAVAEKLRSQGVNVFWLATLAGMEHRLVAPSGIPLFAIDIQGLRGNGLRRLIAAPFKIIKATLAAMQLMKSLEIDVVVGFGGYVTGPGGFAARLLGIKLVLHEQNAIAGMTNRQLARIATTVLQAFPNAFPPSEKVRTTGNPVRAEILNVPEPAIRFAQRSGTLQVLVIGGSLGAQALNERIPQALIQLASADQLIHVRHQCGAKQVEETLARYQSLTNAGYLTFDVVPFVDNMAAAYAAADFIICRAGALTVSEVAAVGLPAVFIPLPHAVDDHQTANARYLSDVGAALLCPQVTLTTDVLAEQLRPLMNREILLTMAEKSRMQAKPCATVVVVDAIVSM
jgi:UDP-N-acetylglucosamine--N-acetylmuramyl-(pentapeptide) pyrophosphoryl-undecaprenol N-acetylglucosamine transferase